MKLTAPAVHDQTILMVDAVLTRWVEPGVLLSVEGRETVVVESVGEGAIGLVAPMIEDHDAGVEVLLLGVPISVDGNVADGAVILFVTTVLDIVGGDQLLIDTVTYDLAVPPLLMGLDVLTGIRTWQVQTVRKVHRAVADQSTIYLRGNPAYVRQRCPVPSIPAIQAMTAGPFLIDRVSGTLVGDDVYPEVMTVQLRGAAFQAIGNPIVMSKNTPIIRATIGADAMLFWRLANGRLNWNGATRRTAGFFDALGRFRVTQPLVPAFPVGQIRAWNLQVKAIDSPPTQPVQLTVQIDPDAPQTFTLVPNVDQTVRIAFPPADAQRIRVAARGKPGARVEFGAWTIQGSPVKALDYTVQARADGVFRWATSGLLVKPYFLNLEYVRARFDVGTAYDSGYCRLE